MMATCVILSVPISVHKAAFQEASIQGKRPGCLLLQVNMKVLKAATNDIRGLMPSDGGLDEVAREARCAAFACGAALVVATQEKENIFAILLKDPKSADPAGGCCIRSDLAYDCDTIFL